MEQKRRAISIAVLAWNFSFLPEDDQQKAIVDVLEHSILFERKKKTEYRLMMQYLLEKRKTCYPHMESLIVDYDIKDVEGEVSLKVETMLLTKRPHNATLH